MCCRSGFYHNDHSRKNKCQRISCCPNVPSTCCAQVIALLPGIVSAANTTVTQSAALTVGLQQLPPALQTIGTGLNIVESGLQMVNAGLVTINGLAAGIIANQNDPAIVAALAAQIQTIAAGLQTGVSGLGNTVDQLQTGVTNLITGANQAVTASIQVQASAQTTLDLAIQARNLASTC